MTLPNTQLATPVCPNSHPTPARTVRFLTWQPVPQACHKGQFTILNTPLLTVHSSGLAVRYRNHTLCLATHSPGKQPHFVTAKATERFAVSVNHCWHLAVDTISRIICWHTRNWRLTTSQSRYTITLLYVTWLWNSVGSSSTQLFHLEHSDFIVKLILFSSCRQKLRYNVCPVLIQSNSRSRDSAAQAQSSDSAAQPW